MNWNLYIHLIYLLPITAAFANLIQPRLNKMNFDITSVNCFTSFDDSFIIREGGGEVNRVLVVPPGNKVYRG